MKNEINKNGIIQLKHGDYIYPITLQLIKDGRKNKVLSKKIFMKIQVSMFHGKNDEVVPVFFSRKVLNIFRKSKKKLFVINKGDHSLSDVKSLKLINKHLLKITENIS